MASYVPVVKNGTNGAIFYVGLVDQSNTKLLKANPTIATGDFKISIDGGAFANLGTLPTVTPALGRAVKITLSQAEANGDNLVVQCVDAAGSEWCDLIIDIQTTASQIDDLATSAILAAVKAKTDFIVQGLQKNVAFAGFQVFMVSATNPSLPTGLEGLAVAGGKLRKGLDTLFVPLDNPVTELDAGLYQVDLTANDLNADIVTLGFVATGAQTRTITVITKP